MVKKNLVCHRRWGFCIILFIIFGLNAHASEDYLRGRNLYFRGMDYLEYDNYAQAINPLLESYSISKNSRTAHALSYCYGMLGDYRLAKHYAREALRSEPQLPADMVNDAESVLRSDDNTLRNYFIAGSYDGFVASRPYRINDPCIYTNRVTDELPGQECPPGYAIKGIKCRGSNCDDKYLKCCPANYNFRYNEVFMSGWFSEEPPSGFWNDGSVIVGLWCNRQYCDNLNVKAIPVNNPAIHCYHTNFFSEEGWGYGECADGYFVTGITCSGGYCDNLSLRCCRRQ